MGAVTSQEYRADPFFAATAHLKKIVPGEIFQTWAKNTSAPRRTLSRQIPPGGAHILRRGRFFGGRFHFATPAPFYTVSQKLCQSYFLNNSVKHWQTLLMFGTQHYEDT